MRGEEEEQQEDCPCERDKRKQLIQLNQLASVCGNVAIVPCAATLEDLEANIRYPAYRTRVLDPTIQLADPVDPN